MWHGRCHVQGLHKDPIATIAAEPDELLDKTRYQFCRRQLSPDKEDHLHTVLQGLSQRAAKRGMLVKPFFEDASRDPNSVRLINHVTPQQFKQVWPAWPNAGCVHGMHELALIVLMLA